MSLPLEGTNSVTFANGSTSTVLTALARATLVEKTVTGVVLLAFASQEILLGMDFLRKFESALVISEKMGIALMQEKDLPGPPPANS